MSMSMFITMSISMSMSMFRFVASSSPGLDKLNIWSLDWEQNIRQKLDRGFQQSQYDIKTVREQVKVMESIMIEGLDRQWQCDGRARQTPVTTETTTTTTITTTLPTTSTTTTTTTSEAEMVTTSLSPPTTVRGDDEVVTSDSRNCWEHKQRYPNSNTGVFLFQAPL